MSLSIPEGLCRLAPPALRLGQRRMLQGKAPEVPEHVLRLAGVGPGRLRGEWSLPGFVTMFLPEFPHRAVPGHEHFQVKNKKICFIRHTSAVLYCLSSTFSNFVIWFLPFFSDKVLGYIAKGSFGPILKVRDKSKQKTYAVKVSVLPDCYTLMCLFSLFRPWCNRFLS